MGDVDLTLSSLGQQEFKEMKPDTQEISEMCVLFRLMFAVFFPLPWLEFLLWYI